ncbi:M50 family metallopeptidase [Alphaproteobacteria bacterium KMM 3653]|uniref:M50 family metallopeptidase n=1 Tax=Harenicola maris TaxID=2841044 RepID=A0AAP2G474_9RHOB|nr:M50 family metallopeptidase [Harenicola maris]
MERLKGHWQLIALTALVFALWSTPVVVPLKILVVFFHELAHGLAAILTGGSIVELSLVPGQGGHALTRGGSRFLILSAGYMGSLLIGLMLLLVALRTQADRLVLGLCGLVMLVVTALYIRDIFPLLFCGATGAGMLAIAQFLPVTVNDLVLRVIGLTSLIYAPYDIFSDTIARSSLRSDAFMLAEEFWGSAAFWGGIWLVISLCVIGLALRYGLGPASNLSFGPSDDPRS